MNRGSEPHLWSDVLRLRVLVAALGDGSQSAWWSTRYLSPVGIQFLEYIFPRTALAAAVRATSVAANGVHDQSIGQGRTFHLFRLPAGVEQELHKLLDVNSGGHLGRELGAILGNADELAAQLRSMAADSPVGDIRGPWHAGTANELVQPAVYGRMARAYLTAFETGVKVFPYIDAGGVWR